MRRFYVETGMGVAIRLGRNEESVRRSVLREVGTYHDVQLVREATAKDLAWVQAMGGHVPRDGQEGKDG